jgi:plasmid replication initiation protein
MRREDKNRVPPRLKVKLPAGYHLEAVPDAYALYVSCRVQGGRMTDLVYRFAIDSPIQEIEAVAEAHWSKGG